MPFNHHCFLVFIICILLYYMGFTVVWEMGAIRCFQPARLTQAGSKNKIKLCSFQCIEMICMMACCDQESCMRNHKTTRHSICCPGRALSHMFKALHWLRHTVLGEILLAITMPFTKIPVFRLFIHRPVRGKNQKWNQPSKSCLCVCFTIFMAPIYINVFCT